MGLFSSRKETIVGTSVVRLIKDDDLPDAIKTGVTKAIFEDGDVSEYVLEELIGSIGVKAERAYEYAQRSYTHGLPSSDIVEASQARAQVQAVLSQIEGQDVLVEYNYFGPPNSLHLGWSLLISQHGYDPVTNKFAGLSALKEHDVFLDDMVVCIPPETVATYTPGVLAQWGLSPKSGPSPSRRGISSSVGAMVRHSPVEVDPDAGDDYVRVEYVWETKEVVGGAEGGTTVATLHRGEFRIPLTEAYGQVNADHFQAKYFVNGVPKYWSYRAGLGTYPTLDAAFDKPPKITGSFFPFLYFRYDKKSELEDKTTDSFKTSKKLSKYFGLDYEDVSKTINENPDIKDVQQAMLVMALPANTKVEVERKYVYKFFDNWFYSKNRQFRTPVTGYIAQTQAKDLNYNRSSVIIQDKRFKMALSNTGIYKRRVAGNIGKIGEHASGVRVELVKVDELVNATTGEIIESTRPINVHYYRKQITQHLYDEIEVFDLKMLYYVFGEYTTTGDEDDDILLIPIDRAITDDYSMADKEQLYARSLHMVFNSMVIVTVKWYQQDWFLGIIQFVGLFMTILGIGPLITSIINAAISGSIAVFNAAVMALLKKLLMGFLIGLAFQAFVKAVGLDAAFLIALVAAAIGYGTNMLNNINGVPGAPWADQLINLASGLTKAITKTLADLMAGLKEAYESFQAFKDESQKQLEEANKLLETNNHLSPFVIFGESPNDFYNRTVHSGNIGINAINAISSYVETALTLPKLDETIGENAYEQ